eukprot:13948-Heterococcus_DN1.PRE.7
MARGSSMWAREITTKSSVGSTEADWAHYSTGELSAAQMFADIEHVSYVRATDMEVLQRTVAAARNLAQQSGAWAAVTVWSFYDCPVTMHSSSSGGSSGSSSSTGGSAEKASGVAVVGLFGTVLVDNASVDAA